MGNVCKPLQVKMVPEHMTFGYVEVGHQSPIQTASIINMGQTPLEISEIFGTGPFTITHDPIQVLAPGDHIDIAVAYMPSSLGSDQGGIYVDSGDARGEEFIRLLGTGYTDYNNPHYINRKANAQALGVGPLDTDMGEFSGDELPDNTSAKVALQILANRAANLDDRIKAIIRSGQPGEGGFYDDLVGELEDLETTLDYYATLAQNARDEMDLAKANIIALGGVTGELVTSIGDANARIDSQQVTITNQLGSLAEMETTLAAHDASIVTTATAMDSLTGTMASLSTELSSTAATVLSNSSAITTLEGSFASMETEVSTANALANSTLSAITTLSGSIATLSNTVAVQGSSIVSTMSVVEGIGSRVGMALNTNGHMIGWIANNDGQSGGLDFTVDYFRLWSPDGTASVAPFEFRNGGVYIKELSVDSLAIAGQAVTASKIKDLDIDTVKLKDNSISLPLNMDFASANITSQLTVTTTPATYRSVGQGNGDYGYSTGMWGNYYYYIGPGMGSWVINTPATSTVSGGVTVFETEWLTVGDSSQNLEGGLMAVVYSTMHAMNIDSGQQHALLVDTGSGYTVAKLQKVAVTTSNGNTKGHYCVAMSVTLSNITIARLKLIVGTDASTGGGTLNSSNLLNISLSILGAKR